jgi:uncharacterized membrane protein
MKKIFLSGVAVIVPVALTLWVLFAFFGSIDNFVNFYLELWFDYSFTGLGFLLALVTIMVTGAVTRTRIGGWFYKLANGIIYKFPGVNQIYKLFKETFDVVTSKQSFKTVVKVEFPKAGVYSIGFLTNENTIFIPTTPNPTSGFLINTNKYEILDMNVEEAIKYVVSIGTVIPTNSKKKTKKKFSKKGSV